MADVITWTTPTVIEAVEGVDLTGMDPYITIGRRHLTIYALIYS